MKNSNLKRKSTKPETPVGKTGYDHIDLCATGPNSPRYMRLQQTCIPSICRSIDLAYCGIDAFPGFLYGNTALQSIDLSNNEISCLPEEIGKFTNLVYLNLEKNKIRTLPVEFGRLKKLKYLNLDFNPLDVELLDIIDTLKLHKSSKFYQDCAINFVQHFNNQSRINTHGDTLKENLSVPEVMPHIVLRKMNFNISTNNNTSIVNVYNKSNIPSMNLLKQDEIQTEMTSTNDEVINAETHNESSSSFILDSTPFTFVTEVTHFLETENDEEETNSYSASISIEKTQQQYPEESTQISQNQEIVESNNETLLSSKQTCSKSIESPEESSSEESSEILEAKESESQSKETSEKSSASLSPTDDTSEKSISSDSEPYNSKSVEEDVQISDSDENEAENPISIARQKYSLGGDNNENEKLQTSLSDSLSSPKITAEKMVSEALSYASEELNNKVMEQHCLNINQHNSENAAAMLVATGDREPSPQRNEKKSRSRSRNRLNIFGKRLSRSQSREDMDRVGLKSEFFPAVMDTIPIPEKQAVLNYFPCDISNTISEIAPQVEHPAVYSVSGEDENLLKNRSGRGDENIGTAATKSKEVESAKTGVLETHKMWIILAILVALVLLAVVFNDNWNPFKDPEPEETGYSFFNFPIPI